MKSDHSYCNPYRCLIRFVKSKTRQVNFDGCLIAPRDRIVKFLLIFII